jgi:tyrosyl-tRNA synthetase
MPEKSRSEMHRLVIQNAVKINGDAVSDDKTSIEIPQEGLDVKVGKKNWFKVVFK